MIIRFVLILVVLFGVPGFILSALGAMCSFPSWMEDRGLGVSTPCELKLWVYVVLFVLAFGLSLIIVKKPKNQK